MYWVCRMVICHTDLKYWLRQMALKGQTSTYVHTHKINEFEDITVLLSVLAAGWGYFFKLVMVVKRGIVQVHLVFFQIFVSYSQFHLYSSVNAPNNIFPSVHVFQWFVHLVPFSSPDNQEYVAFINVLVIKNSKSLNTLSNIKDYPKELGFKY